MAELLGFITAVIGLVAAIVGLWAVIDGRRKRGVVTITPPDDQETRAYIERTIWERKAPKRPQLYNSSRPPIVSIANMKGGVGKTTLTANLGAYFASTPQNQKSLLIDFDYQGSLSQTVLGQAGITDVSMSAHHLLLGKKPIEDALNYAPPMRFRDRDSGFIRLFRATYPFSTIENELFVDWLTNDESEVRYNLLRYLDSAEFKQAYDIALIDCPPRITTATINALSASSGLVIPTQPDGLSIPGAEYFSRQIMRMREETFHKLKLLGVVPSITLQASSLKPVEVQELAELETKMNEIWPAAARSAGNIIIQEAFVPRTQPIRDAAGKGIAYLRDSKSKQIFDRLGGAVRQRI
ncbi:MAG: ParA family protein [Hyphomonadaceae bacterium]|nr:ParA family protein [Hyphomonadaceae bacterium]